jgi:DNA polymerase-3 subunit epsilon
MREIVLIPRRRTEPSQGHRIIEIGCLKRNRTPTGAKYHAHINPERDVPEESQRITNLSTEFLRDKPVFADVSMGFWRLSVIAGSSFTTRSSISNS